MIAFLQTYSKEFVSLLVPLMVAIVGYLLRPRARLVWSNIRETVMLTTEQWTDENGVAQPRSARISTNTYQVANAGRDTANDVEVVFNWRPTHFNTWPQRQYEAMTNPEGRFVVKFPNLAPKEFVRFELLAVNAENPALLIARSKEGIAKLIQTTVSKVEPCWKLWLVIYLMLAGIFGTVYAGLSVLQFALR